MSTKQIWEKLIDNLPEPKQIDFLKAILLSRKRSYRFSLNGSTQMVGRTMVRDYLQSKHPNIKNTRPDPSI